MNLPAMIPADAVYAVSVHLGDSSAADAWACLTTPGAWGGVYGSREEWAREMLADPNHVGVWLEPGEPVTDEVVREYVNEMSDRRSGVMLLDGDHGVYVVYEA